MEVLYFYMLVSFAYFGFSEKGIFEGIKIFMVEMFEVTTKFKYVWGCFMYF